MYGVGGPRAMQSRKRRAADVCWLRVHCGSGD